LLLKNLPIELLAKPQKWLLGDERFANFAVWLQGLLGENLVSIPEAKLQEFLQNSPKAFALITKIQHHVLKGTTAHSSGNPCHSITYFFFSLG